MVMTLDRIHRRSSHPIKSSGGDLLSKVRDDDDSVLWLCTCKSRLQDSKRVINHRRNQLLVLAAVPVGSSSMGRYQANKRTIEDPLPPDQLKWLVCLRSRWCRCQIRRSTSGCWPVGRLRVRCPLGFAGVSAGQELLWPISSLEHCLRETLSGAKLRARRAIERSSCTHSNSASSSATGGTRSRRRRAW